MKASKKRYDNKHKVTRVFLGDYIVLKEYSEMAGVSMAEALHKIITGQDLKVQEPKTSAEDGQIPMSIFRVMPVTSSIAVNGSKVAAFASKPKGVKYG